MVVGFMANVGNAFIKRFFLFFPTFLRFLTFSFNFYLNVCHIDGGVYFV